MAEGCVLVLDVGKTNAKLSLWTRDGRCLRAMSRANTDKDTGRYLALDASGVEAWLGRSLKEFAAENEIAAIVPIAHGAASALMTDGRLAAAPMSYEMPISPGEMYERARDAFADTGSPRLPNGLNLGAQLQVLERVEPDAMRDARIVTYPQYWAWVLSGVAASEVSSLGCHSDLWRPREARFSGLAVKAGWAERFAPLRLAADVLGPIRRDLADETGISRDCIIYCGAHDSNAAFYGTRAHSALQGRDVTVISTGTWFVAMRAPVGDEAPLLGETRDTLLNVGIDGALVPSARFMGGREMEALIGAEDSPMRSPDFARNVAPLHAAGVIASGAMIAPTCAPGVGPFAQSKGRWVGEELHGAARRAAAGIYLALVADTSLSLIGAREAIVVEGRFADDLSFLGMLAALRPEADVYASNAADGIAYGALRLVDPNFTPPTRLTKIAPIAADVSDYTARWREIAAAHA